MDPLLGVPQPYDGHLSGDGKTELAPKAHCLRGFVQRFQGWRIGVSLCAVAAILVLAINVLFTIAVTARYGSHAGLVTFVEGSCTGMQNLSIWLHLLLNILSTVLLAASNYCMQCLSSPTRADIDKAHARHRWLDIGIPSVRNLFAVSRRRALLWALLALSSVPLHLLYNSVVIPSKSTQEYTAYVASIDLVAGNGINWTAPVGSFEKYDDYYEGASFISYDHRPPLSRFRDISSTWDRMSNDECIRTYAQPYVHGHGDVVMVSPALNSSVPMLAVASVGVVSTDGNLAWKWMCTDYSYRVCTQNDLRETSSTWTLNDTSYDSLYSEQYPVQYCLSEPVPERCAMQLSIIIMVVVILCNVVKALYMFLILWHQRSVPLVTIGDTVQSFLQEPDPTTNDMCWAGQNSFSNRDWKGSAKPWHSQRHLWFAAASPMRWLACNILSIATIVAAGILFRMGLKEVTGTAPAHGALGKSGFGEINTREMAAWSLGGTSGLLGTILVANSPQLLLSFLFLAYNALFTCMLLAEESNGYAHERKSLRVSAPTGNQRSTYRLQLPYKYGIPLLIALTLLHWLISQSLFLARVNVFTSAGRQDTNVSISTVGYSVLPLVVVLVIASLVVLMALLMGFRRLKPGLPLVGSNSAAISAACHAPMKDFAASEKSLMWGAVDEKTKHGVGHCSFTSFEVRLPIDGQMYAGDKI
ncbi:MAG: hypothetical protein Q9218_002147 [Villophora microphyllina]